MIPVSICPYCLGWGTICIWMVSIFPLELQSSFLFNACELVWKQDTQQEARLGLGLAHIPYIMHTTYSGWSNSQPLSAETIILLDQHAFLPNSWDGAFHALKPVSLEGVGRPSASAATHIQPKVIDRLKGLFTNFFFYRLNLIFLIVMECGKAHFGRRDPWTSQTWKWALPHLPY